MTNHEVDAPRIWTRRPTIIEPKSEILVGGPRLRGFFKMEAVRTDGRRRLLADWFPNLITDAGLNLIGTSSTWLTYCRVGTGSTAPANGNTALASHLAETVTKQSNTPAAQGSAPYYGSTTIVYRFGQGVAAGNLAEVGISDQAVASSTDVLFSRALILDSSGDPTTITVLSDEFLDVTYQIRFYPPASDVTHTVNISGTDYTVIERASSVTDATVWSGSASTGFQGGMKPSTALAYAAGIGAVTTTPSGTTFPVESTTNAAYGNNNLYRDGTLVWGLTFGNVGGGGIGSVSAKMGAAGSGGMLQYDFDPNLPKTSSMILSLVFRHTWGRGQS